MFFEKRALDFSSGFKMPSSDVPATWSEIFADTFEGSRLAGQTMSSANAIELAYDRRIDAIRTAVGLELPHPYRQADEQTSGINHHALFQSHLDRLAEQHPDKRDVIAAHRPVVVDARDLARQAEEKSNDTWERAGPGVAKYIPMAAAEFSATLIDPVNLAATLAFGPFGRVGTGAGAVAWNGLKAAAANAGAEAIAQPFIQRWRAEAGLSHGWDQAAAGIAGAALFGFAADVGVRSVARGIQRARGRTPVLDADGGVVRWQAEPSGRPLDDLQAAAEAAPKGSPIHRAANGDPAALREIAEATGLIDDPAVRGALAELDRASIFGPPPKVDTGDHLSRLAEAIQRSVDPSSVPPAAATPQAEPVMDWPDLSGAKEASIGGKTVGVRAIDARAAVADAEVLAGLRQSRGAGIAFEAADGTMTLQRQAARTAELEGSPQAYVFREADGWTIDDARMFAARQALEEESGSALDMATLLRSRPELADRTLPLTDYKFRQALGLAKLSDDAFGAVRAGRLAPGHAALIGHHVEDASRHAGLIEAMAAANIRSAGAARQFLGQALAGPTLAETHAVRFGAGAAERDLIGERSAVLAEAVKQLAKDKRIFAVLEREAPRIREAGNVLDDAANIERQFMAGKLTGLIEKLSQVPGRVSDLLQDAALEVASGVKPRAAATTFTRQVAEVLEADGIRGLVKRRVPDAAETQLVPQAMSDPFGPEAKAQTQRLKAEQDARAARAAVDEQEANDAWENVLYWRSAKKIPKPTGLIDYLRSRGGLQDFQGDVRAIIGGSRGRPGLLNNKSGQTLDDAAHAAWEAGYFTGDDRPSVNDLLDAISDEMSGRRVVSWQDREILADLEALDDLERTLDRHGLLDARSLDDVRAILADAKATSRASEGTAAADAADLVQRRADTAPELDDEIPFAIGEGQLRRSADALLRLGRSVTVPDHVVEALQHIVRPHLRAMPEGVDVGILARIEPVSATTVRGVFKRDDGSLVSITLDRKALLEGRAFFHPNAGGRPFIALTGFHDPSKSPQAVVGEMHHEAIHARRRLDKFGVGQFARLVAHAEKLRVLEMEFGTFLAAIGSRASSDWEAGITIRDVYELYYSGRPNKDELIQEEAVAHMVELFVARHLIPAEVDPIAGDLADLMSGPVARDALAEPPRTGANDNTLFAIVGRLAKNSDLKALERAQQLEAAGVDYFRIRLDTGWERGADGAWGYELSDRDARLRPAPAAVASGTMAKTVTARAVDIIDNPLVFEAYPELKRYTIELTYGRGAERGEIDLDRRLIKIEAGSPAAAVRKIVHELQHAIQDKEGWAAGGAPYLMGELNRAAIADVDHRAGELVDLARVAAERGDGVDLQRALDDLERVKAERDALDRQSYVALYLRLAGEVQARNVEARLKYKRAQRIATSLRHTEDVPRDRQIVLRDAPRRQLGEDWEDNWFDGLARQSALYEQMDWQRSTRPVAPDKRGRDPIERAADDLRQAVASFEAQLWKAGETPAEIATKIERKFGFPVAAEQVAKRQVWWRIDELVQEYRRSIVWTPDKVRRLAELEKEGLRPREIAAKLNEQFGARLTADAVQQQIGLKLGGRSKPYKSRAASWTPDMLKALTARLPDLRAGRVTYKALAADISTQSGVRVTPADVERVALRASYKPRGPFKGSVWTPEALALLTSQELDGMSYKDIADLLSRRFEGEFTRNSVASKLHQFRMRTQAAEMQAGEQIDTAATIARACKP